MVNIPFRLILLIFSLPIWMQKITIMVSFNQVWASLKNRSISWQRRGWTHGLHVRQETVSLVYSSISSYVCSISSYYYTILDSISPYYYKVYTTVGYIHILVSTFVLKNAIIWIYSQSLWMYYKIIPQVYMDILPSIWIY